MPDEALISEIENILTEVIELGGQNEVSSIVPNLLVQDANPVGLDGFVIVSDDRDGDNITAKKVGSVIYADNDLVNVMFLKGTEALAFQQGSESNNNGIWEIVPATTTDIFYDKGDVGIGKSVAPDASLEILDTAQSQLRLTHTEDTKFADFTLDTNHDLTIKPSSTGQIILQPTTDSTDFFQVLDADGGAPVLNVDSTNERVGVGKTPDQKFHVYDTVSLIARFEANSATAFSGFQNQADDSSKSLNAQMFGGSFAGTQFGVARADTASLFSDGCLLTFGTKTNFDLVIGTNNTEAMRIDTSRNVGIGTTAPQGILHTYDTIGGSLVWEYDGLDTTVRTVLPNGAGDCLYRLQVSYVFRNAAGVVVSGAVGISNGSSSSPAVGVDQVRIRVNADGSIDVARVAGVNTIKVLLHLLWL